MLILNTRTLHPNNLLKTFTGLRSGNVIVAKYSQTPETRTNWGDAVNPIIISHLTKKPVVNINDLAYYTGDVYAVIGSILDNNKVENLCVFGSGFKFFKSTMQVLPKRVHAVRGPLTRNRLIELGVTCPDIYGDPAVLYKQIYNPDVNKRYKLGIIPHYTEKKSKLLDPLLQNPDVLLINIQDELNTVVQHVKSCEHIVSSSLHGLIIADMYNVPSAWIKIEGNLMGDDFKFLDYYSSVNDPKATAIQLREDTSTGALRSATRERNTDSLITNLLNSVPF